MVVKCQVMPCEDPTYDFNCVMEMAKSCSESVENYDDGLTRLEATEKGIFEKAQALKLNQDELRANAGKLELQFKGDILPALNYLSEFTNASDPRYSGTKPAYLTALLVWAHIARKYIQGKRNLAILRKDSV